MSLRITASAVALSAIAGTIGSTLHAHALFHPQAGLHHLTLEIWSHTLPGYLGHGLAGGVIGSLALSWADRASRGSALRGAARLGAWACVWLPGFVRLGLRDGAWLPMPNGRYLAALALLFTVGAGLVALARRSFGGDPPREPRRAAIALLLIAALAAPLGVVALRSSDHLRVFSDRGSAPPPNILVIVLDTVRADRLSSYGYERHTTPALDAFASEAIRFDQFHSTSVWTLPSHASLFTGLFPIRHGATQEHRWLADEFTTLAEILRNAGYRTWGASANPNASGSVNLAQGFETFHDTWRQTSESHDGAVGTGALAQHPNNRAFAEFTKQDPGGRPFFAFINYIDAHVPLLPPSPWLERFMPAGADIQRALHLGTKRSHEHYIGEPYSEEDLALLSGLYDAEIAYLSELIGELLESFREDPRFEDTLIVITSDHGEHFGEQGLLGHMFGLYDVAVRVPLLIRLPGGERGGEVESRKGQLVDLFTTLLEVAGLAQWAGARESVDLLAASGRRREAILSEYYYPSSEFRIFSPEEYEASKQRLDPFKRRLRAIELYGYRYIWSSDGEHELYNKLSDPGEARNLLADEGTAAMASDLQRELDRAFAAMLQEGETDPVDEPPRDADPERELDPHTRDALRALGYVR